MILQYNPHEIGSLQGQTPESLSGLSHRWISICNSHYNSGKFCVF